MASLIVRNIDDKIIEALKLRAGKNGRSAEAEHRLILEKNLLKPTKKSFAQIIASMPNVGRDSDFQRVQNDDEAQNVFD